MKTRIANHADITQIVIFAKGQHGKSVYKGYQFNAAHFRKTLKTIISGGNGDALLAVNDKGQIRGLLLAWHEELSWSKLRIATDIHFVCEQGGDMLLREFKRWARERGCIEAVMGTFNGMDEERIGRLYNRIGFENAGHTFRARLV